MRPTFAEWQDFPNPAINTAPRSVLRLTWLNLQPRNRSYGWIRAVYRTSTSTAYGKPLFIYPNPLAETVAYEHLIDRTLATYQGFQAIKKQRGWRKAESPDNFWGIILEELQ